MAKAALTTSIADQLKKSFKTRPETDSSTPDASKTPENGSGEALKAIAKKVEAVEPKVAEEPSVALRQSSDKRTSKPKPSPKPEKRRVEIATPVRPSAKQTRALRTTISYQTTDEDCVDDILDALRSATGARGKFSDAVKIALRLCPMSEKKIAEAWEEIQADDGRRQPRP